MDNLGSGTYDTFERDPVKYERYEEVRASHSQRFPLICVGDFPCSIRQESYISNVSIDLAVKLYLTILSVLCVVGAGRGPIVSRCLAALDRSQRDGVVYAVEKNPNAFVTCVAAGYIQPLR